jgi:hypothetical protein
MSEKTNSLSKNEFSYLLERNLDLCKRAYRASEAYLRGLANLLRLEDRSEYVVHIIAMNMYDLLIAREFAKKQSDYGISNLIKDETSRLGIQIYDGVDASEWKFKINKTPIRWEYPKEGTF